MPHTLRAAPLAPPPMLGRRLLRLTALHALRSAALAVNGEPVMLRSPGDWSVPESRLPAIILRTGPESKASFNRGMPEFTTTCALEVRALVQAATAEQAQDDIESLWYAVENALLLNWSLVRIVQQFTTVDSVLDIRDEGARHIAGIAGTFQCEYAEIYDPTAEVPAPGLWPDDPPPPVPLERFTTTIDATNVADPTGTYSDAPFPDSVVPAPRTHGPDGRSEGDLDIPLQEK